MIYTVFHQSSDAIDLKTQHYFRNHSERWFFLIIFNFHFILMKRALSGLVRQILLYITVYLHKKKHLNKVTLLRYLFAVPVKLTKLN